jgi:hypothetical protein
MRFSLDPTSYQIKECKNRIFVKKNIVKHNSKEYEMSIKSYDYYGKLPFMYIDVINCEKILGESKKDLEEEEKELERLIKFSKEPMVLF